MGWGRPTPGRSAALEAFLAVLMVLLALCAGFWLGIILHAMAYLADQLSG